MWSFRAVFIPPHRTLRAQSITRNSACPGVLANESSFVEAGWSRAGFTKLIEVAGRILQGVRCTTVAFVHTQATGNRSQLDGRRTWLYYV